MQQITLENAGFATPVTPVSSQGMRRYAKDVDQHLNDILNGIQAFDRMLFASATELAITSGTLAATTQTFHTVAAETGTTDDLTNIPASNNSFVILKAKTGHSIAIRVGVSNIVAEGNANVALTGNKMVLLWCSDDNWSVMGFTRPLLNNSATRDPGSADDASTGYSVDSLWINTTLDRAWVCIDSTTGAAIWKWITPKKNSFGAQSLPSNNPTSIGSVTSQTGTSGSGNDSADVYTSLATGASSGSIIGWINTTFNLVRPDYNPVFECLIKTDSDITAQRYWVGLGSADITNVDTLAAGTKFIGLRFSTVAADGGWMPILNDGTTQANGTAIGTVVASTAYKLRIRVDAANSKAYFSVNDGAEQSMTSHFPASSTDMAVLIRFINTTANNKITNIAHHEVGW